MKKLIKTLLGLFIITAPQTFAKEKKRSLKLESTSTLETGEFNYKADYWRKYKIRNLDIKVGIGAKDFYLEKTETETETKAQKTLNYIINTDWLKNIYNKASMEIVDNDFSKHFKRWSFLVSDESKKTEMSITLSKISHLDDWSFSLGGYVEEVNVNRLKSDEQANHDANDIDIDNNSIKTCDHSYYCNCRFNQNRSSNSGDKKLEQEDRLGVKLVRKRKIFFKVDKKNFHLKDSKFTILADVTLKDNQQKAINSTDTSNKKITEILKSIKYYHTDPSISITYNTKNTPIQEIGYSYGYFYNNKNIKHSNKIWTTFDIDTYKEFKFNAYCNIAQESKKSYTLEFELPLKYKDPTTGISLSLAAKPTFSLKEGGWSRSMPIEFRAEWEIL